MSVYVKVCGITRLKDAMIAVEYGASALGFVFYDASPRHVDFATAARIVSALPRHIAAVGVFVNPSVEQLKEAVERIGLDAVQLHGDEPPEFLLQIDLIAPRGSRPTGFLPRVAAGQPSRVATIKAVRVRDEQSLTLLSKYTSDLWLLDAYVAGVRGGTGKKFDWTLASTAVRMGPPVVIAGGLRPENVASAIRAVNPHAVDVSSGVECSPGVKDARLLRAFIDAVRSAA